MKKLFFLTLIAFLMSGIMAQQRNAAISFNSENFDFGQIKEGAGSATHKFEFTNTGSQPLVITNVTTSCGCTSPAWTREPVMPGAKGFVSATYDVKGRPGKFEKTISVSSNADRSMVVLKISGDVTQSLDQMYPSKFGLLNIRSPYIIMAVVNKGEVKTASTDLFNSSDIPVALSFSDVPAHLKVSANPVSIAPGQIGHIDIVFDSNKKEGWGSVIDRFRVIMNGKTDGNYWLNLSTKMVEDFSKLTSEQLKNAPFAKFDNTTFDFGRINSGEKIKHEFMFKNTGNSELLIRNLTASCGCTAVKPKENVIKPGNSSSIIAEFDSEGKNGYQNKTITVITNDPKNSEIILWIKGEINSK
jgi:Protein of unknown function (DUF1573)